VANATTQPIPASCDTPGKCLSQGIESAFVEAGSMPKIKATHYWFSIASLTLLITFVSKAGETTVSSILANPVEFDGKSVTVRGIATEVKPTMSRKGRAYTAFQLQDGSSVITVYMRGDPATKNGNHVEVTGVFQTAQQVGPYTAYKIEAQRITPMAR
jgi:hypothetical protein